MSQKYHIVEPHPSTTTTTTTHVHTARGGAGNVTKVPLKTTRGSDASGPASRITLTSPSRQPHAFTSGRGGAGNAHQYSESERAIFSFDEELERQLRRDRDVAPVYHVGRGGAGNVTVNRPGSQMIYLDGSVGRRKDSESDSAKSASSVESGADVATRNLKKGLQKGWGKVVGIGSYMTG